LKFILTKSFTAVRKKPDLTLTTRRQEERKISGKKRERKKGTQSAVTVPQAREEVEGDCRKTINRELMASPKKVNFDGTTNRAPKRKREGKKGEIDATKLITQGNGTAKRAKGSHSKKEAALSYTKDG